MVRINKGGRPRKLAGEKMKYKVTVKMSTIDYYTLKGKAKEAGFSLSEFIRNSIKQTSVVQRLTPQLNDEIRKLSGMANNLNQIARKANALGYDHVRTEYLFLADKIDRLINRIL
ncbi:MAG: plasmid mobilization relaxosome protein MobC [Bacteroidota bacterium]